MLDMFFWYHSVFNEIILCIVIYLNEEVYQQMVLYNAKSFVILKKQPFFNLNHFWWSADHRRFGFINSHQSAAFTRESCRWPFLFPAVDLEEVSELHRSHSKERLTMRGWTWVLWVHQRKLLWQPILHLYRTRTCPLIIELQTLL